MGDLPLRTPTHRRLGGPLPRQPANAPHGHPPPMNVSPPGHAPLWAYGVLVGISTGYPPVAGRFHTCYSPVRRSPASKASFAPAAPRLACVRPVASVHPEPGSNSPLLFIFLFFFFRFFQLSEKYQLNPANFAPQLSNAQIYRFLPFVFTRNHDVDSVVISFPCLSLFPCLSQSFQ